MFKVVVYLTKTQKTLESYAEVAAPRDVTQQPVDPPPGSEAKGDSTSNDAT